MTDVIKFYPKGSENNPDVVLETNIGHFEDVLLIGYDKGTGELTAAATAYFAEGGNALWAIECFKTQLLNGQFVEAEE